MSTHETAPSTPERVRVGLVGAGGIATVAHLPTLKSLESRVEVVGITDLDPHRVRQVAEEWGIPGRYDSVDELLSSATPDLLIVCTPPSAHRDAVIKGLRSGAWVWCEKPPVLSLAEYDEIQAEETSGGPYASFVVQHRFGSGAATLKQQVQDGDLGRPLVAMCNTLWFRPHSYYEVPWRGRWDTEGGGPAMGHGIHQMDLLLEILGDWSEVTAKAEALDRDVETEDVSFAIVRFENGALASVVNSVLSPRETSYLRFDFQDATVELEHLYGYDNSSWTWTPAEHRAQGDDERRRVMESWLPAEDVPSSHKQQLSELLDAMTAGVRPRASGHDGRRTLEFISALYQSAETGRTIRREDLANEGIYYTGMHDSNFIYGSSRLAEASPSSTKPSH
ncbi:Gfo/Idh/MocA family protein [Nesterenkonia halotolerans]|uniref:Dehydrogenase n=1 Tax=Nesterenkonia halotolerans TaxID=225325 RepID=A0ABR9J8J9_9MICC|nr:Gfo/Idh/MocA family oxidoreductase [Nesterenkonia halotolerans]MBE1515329.1 putative dehydrogenase [Nesterenkonia halotolerans]